MLRLGRVGEVRGTMTGRDELVGEPGRPTPAPGETGCRTKGEDDDRELGRDDELRVLGRVVVTRELDVDDELRVVGSVEERPESGRPRPLEPELPATEDGDPPLRVVGAAPGSTSGRVVPPPERLRPGR
jgi:hypothetical protein